MMRSLHRTSKEVALEIGQSCDWPNNLLTGSHLISQDPGYVNGTRQTIMAGGDCCSRNMFVEVCFAVDQGTWDFTREWHLELTPLDATPLLFSLRVLTQPCTALTQFRLSGGKK
jgi:hypothetical protein